MNKELIFSFNDQLPLTFHVVKSILELSPGGAPKGSKETNIRKKVVHAYATSLRAQWVKAFSEQKVLSINTVKKYKKSFK